MSATDILKADQRELIHSKGELNKLRKGGKIPANIFGKELDNSIPVFVDLLEFERIYNKAGKVFQVDVGGTKHMTNAKVIQRHPVSHSILHVAFHKLKRGEATTVAVPVHTVGDAPGVKAGGVLSVVHEMLKVSAPPSKIPEHIDVDISGLELDGNIKAGEIKLPAGITLADAEDETIVSCKAPKAEAEEPAAAEGEGDAPAAEAPAEGGDKPAEGGE